MKRLRVNRNPRRTVRRSPTRTILSLSVFVRHPEERLAKRLSPEFRKYAVVGAEQRLLQLAEEAAEIFAIFPELRGPGRGFMSRVRGGADRGRPAGNASKPARKRRRTMSADARRRISEAQKKRWAKQKAGGKNKKKG